MGLREESRGRTVRSPERRRVEARCRLLSSSMWLWADAFDWPDRTRTRRGERCRTGTHTVHPLERGACTRCCGALTTLVTIVAVSPLDVVHV